MKRLLPLLLLGLPVLGQDTLNFPVLGEIIRTDSRIDRLIPAGARLEVLASGFDWSEGPVWVQDGQYLLFSDIPRNSVMKWKEGEGASLFLKPSGYTGVTDYGAEPGSNGLLLDSQGRLVSCEHGDRGFQEEEAASRPARDRRRADPRSRHGVLTYHQKKGVGSAVSI